MKPQKAPAMGRKKNPRILNGAQGQPAQGNPERAEGQAEDIGAGIGREKTGGQVIWVISETCRARRKRMAQGAAARDEARRDMAARQ
jgi:hypothetical protein